MQKLLLPLGSVLLWNQFVSCIGLNDSFRQYFIHIGLFPREREKKEINIRREKISNKKEKTNREEKKTDQNPPSAPTASTVGSCPTNLWYRARNG